MQRRICLVVLALVAFAATAQAERRAVISLRACEGVAKCTTDQKLLYSQAFARNEPVIELMTMGIGALMWERHGHIALCVRYPHPEDDICFNYGIGDFHEPGKMAWGFFRGTKSFWAGKQEVLELMQIYAGRDRTVWAQPIPLTLEQKTKVIQKLESDILEQNRYYAYDHFWDNCTTRVRDILDDVTDHALRTMPEEAGDDRTFRDLARDGFWGMRLPLLITDIAMGRITDQVPTYWERMFLPQYLREAVQKKWGVVPIILYERHAGVSDRTDADANGIPDIHEDANGNGIPNFEEDVDHNSGRVLFALFVLAVCAPAVLARYFGRFQRIGLAIAIIPPVLLGSALWFLAIISPLKYVELNETCLIFLPLDLALLVLPLPKRTLYAKGRVAMLGLMALLMLIGVLKQPLFAELLWPLIPAALVGFWPARWTRTPAVKVPEAKAEKSKPKAKAS
ncbi:MAG: DUF4105 domain-containing protein [Kofleriaceae bacterium]